MHTRLFIAIAVSGVVHAGAFVIGSGFYEDFVAGLNDVESTITLTVSVVSSEESDPPQPIAQEPRFSKKKSPAPQTGFHPSRAASMTRSPAESPPEEVGKPDASRNMVTIAEASPIVRNEEPANPWKPQTSKARLPEPVVPEDERQQMPGPQVAAIQTLNERQGDATEQRYLTEFLAELSRHKYYPRSARLGRQEGKVVVSLLLLKDGSIEHVRVEEPSRFSVLNRAAVKAVARIGAFKPFPPTMNRDSWQLSVPFQYSITSP